MPKSHLLVPLVVALIVSGWSTAGDAADAVLQFRTTPVIGGSVIEYGVLAPAELVPGKTYRTILALPPGGQDQRMVRAGLAPWRSYLAEHDWIVISPAAPDGRLFFKGAEFVLPGFMDHLLDAYPVEDGKFYLLGVSNGGISAFRAGILYPDRFRSITVVPGYPLDPDAARLARLTELPVTMVVGARDGAWTERSQSTFEALTALGGDPHLVVVPDGDHFIYEGILPETLAAYILRR